MGKKFSCVLVKEEVTALTDLNKYLNEISLL